MWKAKNEYMQISCSIKLSLDWILPFHLDKICQTNVHLIQIGSNLSVYQLSLERHCHPSDNPRRSISGMHRPPDNSGTCMRYQICSVIIACNVEWRFSAAKRLGTVATQSMEGFISSILLLFSPGLGMQRSAFEGSRVSAIPWLNPSILWHTISLAAAPPVSPGARDLRMKSCRTAQHQQMCTTSAFKSCPGGQYSTEGYSLWAEIIGADNFLLSQSIDVYWCQYFDHTVHIRSTCLNNLDIIAQDTLQASLSRTRFSFPKDSLSPSSILQANLMADGDLCREDHARKVYAVIPRSVLSFTAWITFKLSER